MLNNMDLLLYNIPIKPICQIVLEYCNYPRPFIKELNNATREMFKDIDWRIKYDMGYSVLVVIKAGKSFIFDQIHQHYNNKTNRHLLLKEENKRRICYGLNPNEFLYDLYQQTATNKCYMGY